MFDASSHSAGHGNTLLHRCPPSIKLLSLAVVSVGLFAYATLWLILPALAVSFGLYALAGFSLFLPVRQFKPMLWLFGLLFIFSAFNSGWLVASIIVLRLVCLFILANLVTLTTPLSRMMACFERIFIILKPFGCHPAKVALVFSLTLRFIPLIHKLVTEIRQAQAARGMERSLIAFLVPTVVLMLKMSEDVANALEARGFDS